MNVGPALGLRPDDGVVLVDHGSRVAESNAALLVVAERFKQTLGHRLVEPAHMELAEPSIDQAVAKCVAGGAQRIVVVPFFLLPGRHWRKDIPELTGLACRSHGNLPYLVTAPLGDAQGVVNVLIERMTNCLHLAEADQVGCELCHPGPGCWRHSLEHA